MDGDDNNGDCIVPHGHVIMNGSDEINLGTWLVTQRVAYSSGTPPYHRRQKLNELVEAGRL
jgi:hypothetical protein